MTKGIKMQTEKITFPELQEGETHLCAFVNADGSITHTILMKEDKENINWLDAMAWAKEIGGDLPTRAELILLYENHQDKFKHDWYWSNTQHASHSDSAWYQNFSATALRTAPARITSSAPALSAD